jgi:hypothetical protein
MSYHSINVLNELILKFPSFLILLTTEKFNSTMIGLFYLSEFLIYPFSTAYKRFICQVNFFNDKIYE